ncbi:MAG: hypothetical protein AAGC74_07330 [Verrucomicrobiota bacterium]
MNERWTQEVECCGDCSSEGEEEPCCPVDVCGCAVVKAPTNPWVPMSRERELVIFEEMREEVEFLGEGLEREECPPSPPPQA